MSNEQMHQENIAKLRDILKGMEYAMLTTLDEYNEALRSRPMAMQQAEFDGDLWFFTRTDTEKVDDIWKNRKVNVSFSDPGKNTYVSIYGTAQIVRDRTKMKELWSPVHKAWFPDGLDDPKLGLIKVTALDAEYWTGTSSKIIQFVGMVKSLVTGTDADDLGENEKLQLK